ncbi:restriction endonuclease subunit S [Donghicola sp.]|jgi:type I restriction enzyme S subunit|uniref:restriction endonuclease subunit S n=1 Tax=Donghicola sp. TaxID=1929294 RepID=UPI0025ED6473|nr:restriction endonuclease subunit S [Donghicola sp.]MCT4579160.1 restriction endonuclease subunit S [Donghicola sp.]
MNWPVVPLGEIVTNLDGKRVPLKKSDREAMNGSIPYYGASGIIDQVNDWLFEGPHLLVGEDGANLLSRSSPIAFLADGRFWVNNHAHVLAFNGNADLKYLMYYLESIELSPFVTGSAQPKLNQKQLNSVPIPLPPLEEQKRIAGILDQAAELCRLRTRALDKLNTLGQAIFHEMFGDHSCHEEMLKKLGRIQTGSTPSTTVPEYFDGDIPFVTPGDLESNRLPARHLSPEGAEMSRTVSAGATLVCCIGATIGKVGMSTELSAFNQQINAIEWSDQVLPAFGYFAMQQIKPEIIHRGKGAATTLPILKKSEFEKLKVRVASLDQQKIFVDRIGAIGPLVTKADLALRSSETLFAALQHRAFRGGLGDV